MAGAGPALLAARLPGAARLPRVALGAWPTPLAAAPALAAATGVPGLLLKDDGACATPYGGNKVRKLEYLLGDARARGCTAVLTFGAAGSNHVLATAIHARALGLDCHAVLTEQPPTPWVRGTLGWHVQLGTTLHPATGHADSQAIAARLAAGHPAGAHALAVIPWGGSAPLGTLGFVAAGLELAAQCADLALPPQAVYLPAGTLGTAVGLALGLALAGLPTRVIGAVVVPPAVASPAALRALADGTVALLRTLDPAVALPADPLARLTLRTEFLGDGYALPTPAARAAVAAAAEGGLALETTYGGKALAALRADAATLDPAAGPVVFWVTGNTRPGPAGVAATDPAALPGELRRYFA
jgi:D-cysteine desulfhydrase